MRSVDHSKKYFPLLSFVCTDHSEMGAHGDTGYNSCTSSTASTSTCMSTMPAADKEYTPIAFNGYEQSPPIQQPHSVAARERACLVTPAIAHSTATLFSKRWPAQEPQHQQCQRLQKRYRPQDVALTAPLWQPTDIAPAAPTKWHASGMSAGRKSAAAASSQPQVPACTLKSYGADALPPLERKRPFGAIVCCGDKGSSSSSGHPNHRTVIRRADDADFSASRSSLHAASGYTVTLAHIQPPATKTAALPTALADVGPQLLHQGNCVQQSIAAPGSCQLLTASAGTCQQRVVQFGAPHVYLQQPAVDPSMLCEEYIVRAADALHLCPYSSARLAVHIWRRISGVVRLVLSIRRPTVPCSDPHVASSTRRIYATACLWLAAKLEEQRQTVPLTGVMAAVGKTCPAVLCTVELRLLTWLEWCPLRGYLGQ